jgi:hypothetical protein
VFVVGGHENQLHEFRELERHKDFDISCLKGLTENITANSLKFSQNPKNFNLVNFNIIWYRTSEEYIFLLSHQCF